MPNEPDLTTRRNVTGERMTGTGLSPDTFMIERYGDGFAIGSAAYGRQVMFFSAVTAVAFGAAIAGFGRDLLKSRKPNGFAIRTIDGERTVYPDGYRMMNDGTFLTVYTNTGEQVGDPIDALGTAVEWITSDSDPEVDL